MMTSGSWDDPDDYGNRGPGFCVVEMLNTSYSMVEMGKNVKIGEVDPFEISREEETPVGEYVTPKQGATRATRGYGQKSHDSVNRVSKTGEGPHNS